jgi:ABC-type transport system involved in multi-copper enzyme maturation permease subunit
MLDGNALVPVAMFSSLSDNMLLPCMPAGIQVIFYFLYGHSMIAFAFLLSSVFSSSRTAVVAAFIYLFASGLIGSLLLEVSTQEQEQEHSHVRL